MYINFHSIIFIYKTLQLPYYSIEWDANKILIFTHNLTWQYTLYIYIDELVWLELDKIGLCSALVRALHQNRSAAGSRIHIRVDGLSALFACVKRLGLAFKFGFKFQIGDSVPALVISLERSCRNNALLGSFRFWLTFTANVKPLTKLLVLQLYYNSFYTSFEIY